MNKKQKLKLINKALKIYCKVTKNKNRKKENQFTDLAFIIDLEDCYAFYLNQSDIRHIHNRIYLMPCLWKEQEDEIILIILHELAHYHLKHSYRKPIWKKEKAADKLLKKWCGGKYKK